MRECVQGPSSKYLVDLRSRENAGATKIPIFTDEPTHTMITFLTHWQIVVVD